MCNGVHARAIGAKGDCGVVVGSWEWVGAASGSGGETCPCAHKAARLNVRCASFLGGSGVNVECGRMWESRLAEAVT